MKWPPVKAWTSHYKIKERRYFVAINYGGKGKNRWVNMLSVLEGEVYIRVPWEELDDIKYWSPGWIDIEEKRNIDLIEIPVNSMDNSICLHPSEDSGLQIPSQAQKLRSWS
ncbi:TIGR02450 family Trp-rich protein [Prochlorococcus sp. MIT 1223]|uniref:TIGR02450 family Trp-rich protein n=1 Tax=Prochlorococcus sp. MIT 1223 TaxID=3096217 RepID=UPI002A74D673|nr:TIGR02450 family Trp-rich protein [Prochlorococcus sp. MIT 1223]